MFQISQEYFTYTLQPFSLYSLLSREQVACKTALVSRFWFC
jgi:hypothetical protein